MTSTATGKVQTVLGPVEPGTLGPTSTHEHVLIDLRCYFDMPEEATERWYIDQPVTIDMLGTIGKRWTLSIDAMTLLDEGLQTEELRNWYLAGGGTVVDATSIGIGRDPLALTRISRATGVNIVMGASHYVPQSYPPDMDERSEQEITDYIIRDITVGVGDTGIKSGIIGEVASSWPTIETSRRILRASGAASKETGAPVLIHPGFHPDALVQHMNDLTEGGADPTRVIMGHLDVLDLDAVREIAEMGAYIEHDSFGFEDTIWGGASDRGINVPTDAQRVNRLAQLVEWGHESQLVMAHDVCFGPMLASGGGKGYAHVMESVVPRLRRSGFSESAINNLLVENATRALTVV